MVLGHQLWGRLRYWFRVFWALGIRRKDGYWDIEFGVDSGIRSGYFRHWGKRETNRTGTRALEDRRGVGHEPQTDKTGRSAPSDIHRVLAVLLVIAASPWRAVKEPSEGELKERVKRLISVIDPLQVALVGLARPKLIRVYGVKVRGVIRMLYFREVERLLFA